MVKSLFLSRKYSSATISCNDKDIHHREKQSRMAAGCIASGTLNRRMTRLSAKLTVVIQKYFHKNCAQKSTSFKQTLAQFCSCRRHHHNQIGTFLYWLQVLILESCYFGTMDTCWKIRHFQGEKRTRSMSRISRIALYQSFPLTLQQYSSSF